MKKALNWLKKVPRKVWMWAIFVFVFILVMIHIFSGSKSSLDTILNIIDSLLKPERKRLESELAVLKTQGDVKAKEVEALEAKIKEVDGDLKETYKTLGLSSKEIAERMKKIKLRSQ